MRTLMIGCLTLLTLGLGCAPSEHVVELTVGQEITVDFEAVLSGVAEEVIVSFDDLRNEPRYVELRPELLCVGVDLAKTTLGFSSLDGTEGLKFDFTVDISPPGTNQWSRLATYSGIPTQGTSVNFEDMSVSVTPSGQKTLEMIAFSDNPVYDVRLTGTTDGDAASLVIDFHLEFRFSNSSTGCP